MSVAITGLGPDFTRMESFGKVEAFAETLVKSLKLCSPPNSNKQDFLKHVKIDICSNRSVDWIEAGRNQQE